MTASAKTARILVIANRTASTPRLLEEVTRRAHGGASFTLLIPPEKHPEHADWTADDAGQLMSGAARGSVAMLDCGPDALETITLTVNSGQCDEIIVSTVPEHLARWAHHDLPHRLEHLGVPVIVIPHEPDAPLDDDLAQGLPDGWDYPPIPGVGGAGG